MLYVWFIFNASKRKTFPSPKGQHCSDAVRANNLLGSRPAWSIRYELLTKFFILFYLTYQRRVTSALEFPITSRFYFISVNRFYTALETFNHLSIPTIIVIRNSIHVFIGTQVTVSSASLLICKETLIQLQNIAILSCNLNCVAPDYARAASRAEGVINPALSLKLYWYRK